MTPAPGPSIHSNAFPRTNAMLNVFTYGSLMFDAVWLRVIGCAHRHAPARLMGYRRLKIKGEAYPAVIPAASDTFVDGRLYFDVTPEDIRNLDRFEGDHYQRIAVECRLPGGNRSAADVYVFKAVHRHLLDDADWDPVAFEKNSLRIFLAQYKGFR